MSTLDDINIELGDGSEHDHSSNSLEPSSGNGAMNDTRQGPSPSIKFANSTKYTPEGRSFSRSGNPSNYAMPAPSPHMSRAGFMEPPLGSAAAYGRRETMLRFRNDTRVNEFMTKVSADDESDTKALSTVNSISKKIAPFVMEFVGTYLLLFSIGCILSNGNDSMKGLAIGLTLACLVFMGGHISGAHYNPAVSFAIFLTFRGMITLEKMLLYIVIQLVAATLGSLTAIGVTGQPFTPVVGSGHSVGAAIASELIATFFLVSVVLNVATTRSQDNNSFFGLAIGLSVFVMATSIGPISGAALNPAGSFGSFLARGFITGEYSSTAWVYWVGPMVGSCIAAFVFRLTNFQEYTITTGFTVSKICNLKSKGSGDDMF